MFFTSTIMDSMNKKYIRNLGPPKSTSQFAAYLTLNSPEAKLKRNGHLKLTSFNYFKKLIMMPSDLL